MNRESMDKTGTISGWRSADVKALRIDVNTHAGRLADMQDKLDALESEIHNMRVDVERIVSMIEERMEQLVHRVAPGNRLKPVVVVNAPPGVQVQVEQSHASRTD